MVEVERVEKKVVSPGELSVSCLVCGSDGGEPLFCQGCKCPGQFWCDVCGRAHFHHWHFCEAAKNELYGEVD